MVRRKLNLFTFNVRSLVEASRRIDLQNALMANAIDIAFVQETHLRKGQNVFMGDYTFIKDFSPLGTGIAIRKLYRFYKQSIPGLQFPNTFISVKIMVENMEKNVLFGTVYIPCNCDQNLFYDGLSKIFSFSQNFDGVIMGGDFNAKHVSWGDGLNNLNGNTFYRWLQQNSLHFTRLSDSAPSYPNGHSFLDHFLLSSSLVQPDRGNVVVSSHQTFSDHFPLKLQVKLPDFEILLNPPSNFVSYRNTNWDDFRNEVANELLKHFPSHQKNLSNSEIDDFMEKFSATLNLLTSVHSERIDWRNRKFIASDVTKGLFKIKYTWQRRLKKLFHRTFNRTNHEYMLLSKQIQLISIIIRRQVEIDQCRNFSKTLSQIRPGPMAHRRVYNIIGYRKRDSLKTLTIDGQVIEDDSLKSRKLKEHFSNIYDSPPNINALIINEEVNRTLSKVPPNIFEFSSVFTSVNSDSCTRLTNIDEVAKFSRAINNKKSAGLDGISNYIVRKLPMKAFEYLTIIYNNCLNNFYFPKSWKISKIVPIRKKRNSNEIGDLRPISLLSNIGKLFEMIIREKMDLNITHSYIPDLQFGFKMGHSTTDALLKFQNDIVTNLRKQSCTVAVSLDVEKAFDHASHFGILYKMVQIGFDPNIVKLLSSFFSDREFCIQIFGIESEIGSVNCGVPQGSILAPHLYNIFMSDFPHCRTDSTALLYADDALVYAHDESPILALGKVSGHLRMVKQFYDKWGVKINASKSEAICVRNASGKCRRFVVPESKLLRLFLDGEEIPFRDSIKYLGVNFTKLLKFNGHARSVIGKAYKILGAFSKIFWNKNLPENTKILLYKTSIRPVILYAFPIWFNVSPIIIKEMEILERKVLRCCIGKNFETQTKRFSNRFIYNQSKVDPIGHYVFSMILRFCNRAQNHANSFIREIYDQQSSTSWSSNRYLSPMGIENEVLPDFATSIRPDFYNKGLPYTHRG